MLLHDLHRRAVRGQLSEVLVRRPIANRYAVIGGRQQALLACVRPEWNIPTIRSGSSALVTSQHVLRSLWTLGGNASS
jgi:hypothetical protein